MSGRLKRSRQTADLTGDDPEDDTYGSRTTPRKKQKTVSRSKPKKARRRGYGSSDVDEDDEDLSEQEEEEEDISEVSDQEPSPVVKTQSGRPARRSATTARYQDPDTDEDLVAKDEIENSEEEEVRPRARARMGVRGGATATGKSTFIVKLKLPQSSSAAGTSGRRRSRTAGKSVKPVSSSPTYGARRSSRISHSDVEPLISLTPHGKHERVERPGSAEPEVGAGRYTRGAGKRLPTTSAIIEASFEESQEPLRPGLSQQSMFTQADDMEEDAQEGEDVPQTENTTMGGGVIAESVHAEDDEDDEPVQSRRRSQRITQLPSARSTRRADPDEKDSSDFEPPAEEPEADDDMSGSEASKSANKRSQRSEASSGRGRRSTRIAKKKSTQRGGDEDDSEGAEADLDMEELADEAAELEASRPSRRKRRRASMDITYEQPRLRGRGQKPDYRLYRPELVLNVEEDDDDPSQPKGERERNKGNTRYRSLFSTQGPFGAAGGMSLIEETGVAAHGGADSDSSDDEMNRQASRAVGGVLGMTPTTAMGQNPFPQGITSDILGIAPAQNVVGKLKDKKLMADADPLGVDQNVNFDGVGGLDNHINQLKEMVMLPLLYPEIFQQLHIVPPRGVLFHGPPGTGKTLLARALASSVTSQGKKVTFYMRKGADALSKWVGEAEKQIRTLFEEARRTQPSIIFFDEIDGLAPVRSSRSEQIHASIVATLLALMDGMDGRGQVIVIGATNRPDSVDPALRRPGRFDREFYFPLPDQSARLSIIDIHTKGWEPPLTTEFKQQLAQLTKGYGGADIRALCTEAALNAVQGTYPQIYKSNAKLVIDPSQIKVLAKDFMTSVKNMIPSSERQTPSGAAPLETSVEPLLRKTLLDISRILDEVMPEQKRMTALEEAQYDDRDTLDVGFDRELIQQRFERARVFRPRLLVYGPQGMGQHYIGGALLQRFERFHVQSFDLSVLYSDTGRSPEAAVVQLFNEARRHKPSVIYIPNVNVWYETIPPAVLRLFKGLLRSIPPNESVLVLGIMEFDPGVDDAEPDKLLIQDIFGYSTDTQVHLRRPTSEERHEYFQQVFELIEMAPTEFPDLANRKKRVLPVLPIAPPPETPKAIVTKAQLKKELKDDRHYLNVLKIRLQPLVDQLKKSHKMFMRPTIDEKDLDYLYTERNKKLVSTDLPLQERDEHQYRPYEISRDPKGVEGLREKESGKFFYNMELRTVENRHANGYYKRPKDFLADIKRIVKDANTLGVHDKIIKANQMLTTVETDITFIERTEPTMMAKCDEVFQRELARMAVMQEKAQEAREEGRDVPTIIPNVPPPDNSHSTTEVSGPIVLGAPVPNQSSLPQLMRSPISNGFYPGGSDPTHSSNGVLPVEYDDNMSNGLDQSHAHAEGSDPNASRPQTQNTQQRIQQPGLTPMAHGSQLVDYYNDASTTTSGEKKSSHDKSQAPSRSSGQQSNGTQHTGSDNTQHTNGTRTEGHPDFVSMPQAYVDGTPLPDTQELFYQSSASKSSQSNPFSQHSPTSQQPTTTAAGTMGPPTTAPLHGHNASQSSPPRAAVPRQNSAPLANLLNDAPQAPDQSRHPSQMQLQQYQDPQTPEYQLQLLSQPDTQPPVSQREPYPQLIRDLPYQKTVHEKMVTGSSGFSIEQLEQTMSAVMSALWHTRTEWNRVKVVQAVDRAFDKMVSNIEKMQVIARMSQDEANGRAPNPLQTQDERMETEEWNLDSEKTQVDTTRQGYYGGDVRSQPGRYAPATGTRSL